MSAKPETVDDIISRISATAQAKTVQAFSWARPPEVSRAETFDRGPWQPRVVPEQAEESVTLPDPGPFDLTELSDDAPTRSWIVPGLIAEGVVNSLYGSGGVGKTLLAQQLAYYLITAKPFLGIEVERKTSFCVLCEDDRAEINRRHVAIKKGMGSPSTAGVTIWPRVGLENLLVTWNRNNEPQLTKQFEDIRKEVFARRPDLLILDTVADCTAETRSSAYRSITSSSRFLEV